MTRLRRFTLIEMAITVAIFLIVLTIGWASTRDHVPRYRLVKAARRLQSDLLRARSMAVQSARQTRVHFVYSPGDCASDSPKWGGTWEVQIGNDSVGSTQWDTLPQDMDDGSDDEQWDGLTDLGPQGQHESRWICLRAWDPMQGPGADNEDSIVFSGNGWVQNPGSDIGNDGTIEVTLVNLDAARNGFADEITVRIGKPGNISTDETRAPK